MKSSCFPRHNTIPFRRLPNRSEECHKEKYFLSRILFNMRNLIQENIKENFITDVSFKIGK